MTDGGYRYDLDNSLEGVYEIHHSDLGQPSLLTSLPAKKTYVTSRTAASWFQGPAIVSNVASAAGGSS